MKAPTRKAWPPGLRNYCRSHPGLYKDMDALRVLMPPCVTWLMKHWDSPCGRAVLSEIQTLRAFAFIAAVEAGDSAFCIPAHGKPVSAKPVPSRATQPTQPVITPAQSSGTD